MMNKKERIAEIRKQIASLKAEMETLNPYANLKELSNKSFGEQWSEPYICSKCPSFEKKDQKGWDLWSEALGKVEVKSCRLPCEITFNQCHPYDCDYFLFVEYDTEDPAEYIFLVPSKDFFSFSHTTQHERKSKEEAECFSMSGSSKHNKELLENYRVVSWEALEKLAKGEY